MAGIYLSPREDSFRTEEQIKTDLYVRGEIIHHTPLNEIRTFGNWTDEAESRKNSRLEVDGIVREFEIELPTDRPIAIALLGDTHVGGLYNSYKLLADHVGIIRDHPLMYVGLMADLVEGLCWNPGQDEQIFSFQEQYLFINSMLQELDGKILFAFKGEHDSVWQKRTGTDLYADFTRRYNAPVFQGTTVIKLKVGGVEYAVVASHRLPGHSLYNRSHPAMRASKFGVQGADIYAGAHVHRKAMAQQAMQTTNGTIVQTFVVCGPYKYSDEYSRYKGWSQQTEEELGANWLVLDHAQKRVTTFWSSQETVRHLSQYLQ